MKNGRFVVIHSVKLKILKANHNDVQTIQPVHVVVIHSVKLKILKANHNQECLLTDDSLVVIHSVKLKILKANHNWIGAIDEATKLLFTA